MSDRKFHKYTFQVTVLTDEPLPEHLDLQDICERADSLPLVMDYTSEVATLTPKQMADALHEARSEPGFFELDDDGNEAEDV